MYTRRFDEHRPPPDGYSGTFMSGGQPSFCENPPQANAASSSSECPPPENPPSEGSQQQSPIYCQNPPEQARECFGTQVHESVCDSTKDNRTGFLSGLLSRFSRGFELDDLLLIGLLLLLLGERDGKEQNGDELLLVLGLLFFMGF